MPSINNTAVSPIKRRDKKVAARQAVVKTLKYLGEQVRHVGLISDLHAMLAHAINRRGYAKCSLDAVDVDLAVRWLHAKGIIRVSHSGPEFEREHVITLLRQ